MLVKLVGVMHLFLVMGQLLYGWLNPILYLLDINVRLGHGDQLMYTIDRPSLKR